MTSAFTRPSYGQDGEGRWELGPEVALLGLLKQVDVIALGPLATNLSLLETIPHNSSYFPALTNSWH